MKLIVEGSVDKKIARSFLRAADINCDQVDIIVANSSNNVSKLANEMCDEDVAILVDLDSNDSFNADSIIRERYKIHNSNIQIYTAVPQIEAWLFADLNAAKKRVITKGQGRKRLESCPMPEDIPYPKYLARQLFRLGEKTELIERDIDLYVAMKRCPSLKQFIIGVTSSLSVILPINWEEEYVRSDGRDIFSQLMKEVVPSETIVYKTLDGEIVTATEMYRHIREGSHIGLRYSTELLRVARDFLARKAKKGNNCD